MPEQKSNKNRCVTLEEKILLINLIKKGGALGVSLTLAKKLNNFETFNAMSTKLSDVS